MAAPNIGAILDKSSLALLNAEALLAPGMWDVLTPEDQKDMAAAMANVVITQVDHIQELCNEVQRLHAKLSTKYTPGG